MSIIRNICIFIITIGTFREIIAVEGVADQHSQLRGSSLSAIITSSTSDTIALKSQSKADDEVLTASEIDGKQNHLHRRQLKKDENDDRDENEDNTDPINNEVDDDGDKEDNNDVNIQLRMVENYLQNPHFQVTMTNSLEYTKIISGPFEGPNFPLSQEVQEEIQQASSLWQDRVIGGNDVTVDYSHFASLLYWDGTEWKWAGCGGTVVSECHVVTAAHCVSNPSMPVGGVFINALAPYEDNLGRPYHYSAVKDYIVHQNYYDYTNQADIAIIRLETCVDSSKFPIAEPASTSYTIGDGYMVEIMGFGLTGSGRQLPSKLQHANLPFITGDSCRSEYYGRDVLDDMVCAGYPRGGVDACQGDSGSGLVRRESNGYKVVGVVSWGIGCGQAGSPGVYISIPYYYEWIKSNVCSDSGNNAAWCNNSRFTQPPRRNGGTIGDACIYGRDCESGFCRAYSLDNKRCVQGTTIERVSVAGQGGRGGAGGGGPSHP